MRNYYQSRLGHFLICLVMFVFISPLVLYADDGEFVVRIGDISYLGHEGQSPDVVAQTMETGVTLGDVVIPSHIEYNGTKYTVNCCRFPNITISKLTLPPTIDTIYGYSWFENSTIGELTISEGVNHLDYSIFNGAHIDMLCLPGSLKKVSGWSMIEKPDIRAFRVKDVHTILGLEVDHSDLYSQVAPFGGGDLYLEENMMWDLVIPDDVKVINSFVLQGCQSLKSVIIGDSVEKIGNCAFHMCENLRSLELGNRVSVIGAGAFASTSLEMESFVVPASVDTIYSGAFGWPEGAIYSSPKNIIFEDADKDLILSSSSISGCGDNYLYCGRNVKFNANELGRPSWIEYPDSQKMPRVLEIGCGVSDISDIGRVLLDGVGVVISHAEIPPMMEVLSWKNYSWGCLQVPPQSKCLYRNMWVWKDFFTRGHKEIRFNDMYFYGDGIDCQTTLTFGDLEYMGNFVIPEEIEYDGNICRVRGIGSYSFAGLDQLQSVTIPESIEMIDRDAFTGCVGLKSIVLMNTTPPFCTIGSFKRGVEPIAEDEGDIFANATLYVPVGSAGAYRRADGWSNFVNIREKQAVTSLDEVGVASPRVKVSGDGIVIANGDGCLVEVYSIDGQLVNRSLSYGGERIALSKGVYIVKVGASAIKVSL